MHSILTKLITITCLVLLSTSVFAQPAINCELLPGNWSGEHTDTVGNYSQWNASYLADGELRLTFFDENDAHLSIQQGTWACEEGTLSTIMDAGLEKLEFDYEILSLDQNSISYKSLIDETVFHSTRLGE